MNVQIWEKNTAFQVCMCFKLTNKTKALLLFLITFRTSILCFWLLTSANCFENQAWFYFSLKVRTNFLTWMSVPLHFLVHFAIQLWGKIFVLEIFDYLIVAYFSFSCLYSMVSLPNCWAWNESDPDNDLFF